MAHMVDVGRRAAAAPAVAGVLRGLEVGGAYERRLAAQSCRGSRDGAHVLRALNDPSALVSGLATKLTAVACDDRQVRAALGAAGPDLRRDLLARLARRGRRAPTDGFLDAAAARGVDADLARLLPFGSAECVARHLDRFAGVADSSAWARLARHHPDVAAAATEARAAATDRLDARLVWQANAVLPTLADERPDAALRLVRLLARHAPVQRLNLGALARLRPDDVADLVLASEDRVTVSLGPVADRLEPGRLRALAERRPDALGSPEAWLGWLPPARRADLYDACGRGWRDARGASGPGVVALLPRYLREQEGRRHLALPALAARPAERLPYASFLPWDEAAAVLKSAAGSPDPALRGVAAAALVGCGRFHPDRLADVIAAVLARRNEQDPVRQPAMTALAELPPGRWRVEHLDGLGQVLRQALDAADLSHLTAHAAEQLVVSLLPFHPAWSAGWLATLVRERGHVGLGGLADRLTDNDVRRIAPDLLPVLESWETRERRPQLVAAAQSLGRRLRAFDGLTDILENLLYEPGEASTAAQALQVLREHRRDRFARLVPALLAHDPSWATEPAVYEYLHRRAQHLLTPYLGRQAYTGRFSTGRTRFVLPVRSGFFRWTPAQQAAFAKTLDELTRDKARETPTVLGAIDQLAGLPDVPPARLLNLADARNPKPATRDAALRGLGRLDAGRGVPPLIEALQDDRARVAIYALRGALLAMPAAGAMALLRGVPTDKVTVAKEVVRLLGELGSSEALAELLAMGDGTRRLHRDVRVALLRALWGYLDRPEAWRRLQVAAADPDPDVAAGVVRVPAERLDAEGQRRLAGLLAKLLGHPDAKLRLDVLRRVAQLPVAGADRALMPGLLQSMGSAVPDESAAAAAAVFATYAGREASRVGEAVGRLLANRRAILAAVDALESALASNRSHLLPTARAVLAALAADPLTAAVRAGLAVRALPPSELASALGAMAAAGALHADAVAAAVAASSGGSDDFWSDVVRPGGDRWDGVAAALAGQSDDRVRRIGLAALVAAAGSGRGWDDGRLARLEALRADPSALVAGAAQFTFPDGGAGGGAGIGQA
jgi:hypothetical protein